MGQRTFSLDSGYAISCVFRGERRLPTDEVAHDLFRSLSPGHEVLLRNDARLNLKDPAHPEYATPECDSIPSLIAHDKAGDQILEELATAAEQRLREAGLDADVHVYKTGTCLEHYLLGHHRDFASLADMLLPFLVTRQLICGPGSVIATPPGAGYALSGAPAQLRSFINTRTEPYTGARRLRLALSGPNMSELTTALKLGTTDLVLRMIEAGATLSDLALDDPIAALRTVSLDRTGRTPLRLASGRKLSPLAIQREYQTFAERAGSTPLDHRILVLWERVLDALEAGTPDALAHDIDWVIKHQLIKHQLIEQHGPQQDLAYHDISRTQGAYYQLQRTGAVTRLIRDLEIFAAKTIPPPLTRHRVPRNP